MVEKERQQDISGISFQYESYNSYLGGPAWRARKGFSVLGTETNNLINASERIIEEIRAKVIGFAHQANYMIEFLTLYENIALPLFLAGAPKKERDKKVTELLKEVGLKEMAGNRPSQLSLGERKRACIARALINEPRIVLIDEPTANLDAANNEKILALLSKIHKKGTLIVVATHDHLMAKHAKVLKLAGGKLLPQ